MSDEACTVPVVPVEAVVPPAPEPVAEVSVPQPISPPPEDVLEILRAARWYVSQSNGASKDALLDRIDRLLERP